MYSSSIVCNHFPLVIKDMFATFLCLLKSEHFAFGFIMMFLKVKYGDAVVYETVVVM